MPKFDFTNNIDIPSNYFKSYSEFEINLRLRKQAIRRKKFKQQQNLTQPKLELTRNLNLVGKDLDNALDEVTKTWKA